MLVKILGKSWRLVFVPKSRGRGWWGKCDDPEEVRRTITIESGHPQRTELRVLLHEFLHASCYQALDEKFVDDTSSDIARILWRLGWRKIIEGPNPDKERKP